MSKFTIDLTPEGLKTQEGIKRNEDAMTKWQGFQANVANETARLLDRNAHIIEMGIKAALKSGHLDDEDAAMLRDQIQTIQADVEEMEIAQENFLRSFSPNSTEYNPTRKVKRPE